MLCRLLSATRVLRADEQVRRPSLFHLPMLRTEWSAVRSHPRRPSIIVLLCLPPASYPLMPLPLLLLSLSLMLTLSSVISPRSCFCLSPTERTDLCPCPLPCRAPPLFTTPVPAIFDLVSPHAVCRTHRIRVATYVSLLIVPPLYRGGRPLLTTYDMIRYDTYR